MWCKWAGQQHSQVHPHSQRAAINRYVVVCACVVGDGEVSEWVSERMSGYVQVGIPFIAHVKCVCLPASNTDIHTASNELWSSIMITAQNGAHSLASTMLDQAHTSLSPGAEITKVAGI